MRDWDDMRAARQRQHGGAPSGPAANKPARALSVAAAQAYLRPLLEQRCFFLFIALLSLLLAMPFLADSGAGRIALGVINALVLVSAVAAADRSRALLAIAVLLAVPALLFQIRALQSGAPQDFARSWAFQALLYGFTITQLLHYVLRRERITADKLYGAVAAYMMLALFWAFVFGVVQYVYPGAYLYHGTPTELDLGDLIFFSFTVFTTAGFGDITPALIQSRFLTIVEAVSGVMYVAILIARLTGVYPVIDVTASGPRRQ